MVAGPRAMKEGRHRAGRHRLARLAPLPEDRLAVIHQVRERVTRRKENTRIKRRRRGPNGLHQADVVVATVAAEEEALALAATHRLPLAVHAPRGGVM